MNISRSIVLAAAFVTAISTSAVAGDGETGALKVDGAWARPSIGKTGNSAAYMTITNSGGAPDTLIAVTTPHASKAELHTHIRDKDIMRMRQVKDGIPVPANGKAELKPGGFHVMLMKLKEPIKKGTMLPLTLTFKNAGDVTVHANVQMSQSMKGRMDHGKGHMEKKKEKMHKHN